MKHPSVRTWSLVAAFGFMLTACSDKPTDPGVSIAPQANATQNANGLGGCMGDDALTGNAYASSVGDQSIVGGMGTADDFLCTAHDIDVARATVTSIQNLTAGTPPVPVGPGAAVTCTLGDQLLITLNAEVALTTTGERSDIGIWIANNSPNNSAETGSCNHFNLLNSQVASLDNPPDNCGDMNGANQTADVPLGTIQAPCTPKTGTDSMYVASCIGWTVPGGDIACPYGGTSGSNYRWGTLPSSKSKCNCDGFAVPIIVNRDAYIRVAKVCSPTSIEGATFDLQIDAATVPSGDDVACGTTTSWVKVGAGTSASPGATHAASEIINVDPTSYSSSFACTKQSGSVASGNGTSTGNFTVMPNDSITCTFTNVKKGDIKIVKDAQPDADQDFAFTATGTGMSNFSLDDDATPTLSNTKTFSAVDAGTYEITETTVAGWSLTAINCTGTAATSVDLGNAKATIVVNPVGEGATCTFVNQRDPQIRLVKQLVPATDAGMVDFTVAGVLDNNGAAGYGDEGTTAYKSVAPGTVSFSEAGHTGTSLANYTSAWTCDNSKGSGTGTAGSVTLAYGDQVTCTFTNTRLANVTIKKVVDPTSDAGTFTFSNPFDGTGSFTLGHDQTKQFTNVAIGASKTVTETDQTAAGYDLIGRTCTGAATWSTSGSYGISVTPAAGETDIVCTFTNQRRATVTLNKTQSHGLPLTQPFQFQIRKNATTLSSGTIVAAGTANLTTGIVTLACTPDPNTDCINVSGIANFRIGPSYQLCEINMLPGWSNSIAGFTPNGEVPEGSDNGNECINVTMAAGQATTFNANNTPPPEGDARTIGYWKNHSCMAPGNQADVLSQNIPMGGLPLGVLFSPDDASDWLATSCQTIVSLLDKRDNANGKKMASFGEYTLGSQLAAYLLNRQANAYSCASAATAALNAQKLLDQLDFYGTGGVLKSNHPQYANALMWAGILDKYNNNICTP